METREVVNYYELLGLEKESTLDEISQQLEKIQYGWQAKASRAGGTGEKAELMLAKVAEAKKVFVSDWQRDDYDRSLIGTVKDSEAPEDIDWLGRAWNYHFIKDDGAALVAARKAREQDSQDAMAFVVSAWVALQDGERREAKGFADEAFVLDEKAADVSDVHFVRGAVYSELGDYPRAIRSFDRALTKASKGEAVEIRLHKAIALSLRGDDSDAFAVLLEALEDEHYIAPGRKDNFLDTGKYFSMRRIFPGRKMGGDDTRQVNLLLSEMKEGNLIGPISNELKQFLIQIQKLLQERDELETSAKPMFGADTVKKIIGGGGAVLVIALLIQWVLGILIGAAVLVLGIWLWTQVKAYKEKTDQLIEVKNRIKQLPNELDMSIMVRDLNHRRKRDHAVMTGEAE